MMTLFDFIERDRNRILEWAASLTKPDQARLQQKLDRLAQISFDLANGSHLLAGPVAGHIYKLRVNASVMLRPLLCKGPARKEEEYTLLVGAIEKGNRLPSQALETAHTRLELVEAAPSEFRRKHERIGTSTSKTV